MRRPTRGEVAGALLLSVPPGVGVAGLVGFILRTPVSATAALVGALTGAAVFAVLMAGVTVGDPDRTGFRLPEDRNG